jgi:cysteine-rich repeat protein
MGEVLAVCGDGVVQDGEECDDGNEDAEDGCSETCAADVRVFVTSEWYKAGELMGPYLADAICLNRADDAGLANPHRFKAWLSSSEEDARDRFNRDRRGRLVMINGLVLAAGWEALLAGQLENPLEVTEIGTTYHSKVWTGTKADGTAAEGSDHCLDWTTDSVMHDAYYGYSDEVSFEWTLADQVDNPLPCIDPLAIYCFENF